MKEKTKKRLKKIGIWAGIGIVVLLLCIHFFLGAIVKTGVQSYMPKLTGTDVKMGSFYLNTLTGKLTIRDFVIGNPKGYNTEYAFSLGTVIVDIDMTTIFSKKLVVQQILVDKAHVIYEVGLGETNIGKIEANVNEFTQSGKKEPEAKPEPEKKRGEARKIQINDFQFNGAKVSLSAVALQGGKATMPIPDIHLKDIGKEGDGKSWNDAMTEIFSVVSKSVTDVASSAGSVIKGAGEGAWEKVKGVFK